MLYRTESALGNGSKFGPPAGSWNGLTFVISVTVLGLSGLLKAYVSVLSMSGSVAVSGASRWLDA
jgi:hypothetical protein